MLPTKFRFIWLGSFREDFLDIDQSETRIAYRGPSIDAFYQVSRFIWPSGLGGEDF